MRTLARRFTAGFQRHPLRLITGGFLAFSVFWTVLEATAAFLPKAKPEGLRAYLVLVAASLAVGVVRVMQPDHVRFKIRTTNTVLRVSFGDLFAAPGLKAIPVNEFFDSELGEPVSPRSLHGQLITRHFGGHATSFEQLVDRSLAAVLSVDVKRSPGRSRRYPIGTTAVIPVNQDRFLLFAFCRTDIETCKAHGCVPDMWMALEGLWDKARNVAGGDPVTIPLVGGGVSGVGLPPEQLLQLVVLSIVHETKRKQITSEIRVVLHPSYFDEIDLAPLKASWA